ncbi:CLUMA_CG002583, isoform A [Clunio marinus]|uniref:CLUMA_CG002583, isoform A n=1 Tax=Clunio marinus TaxID=568069 RepID=A0A1J1HLF8_9DIPT|nr:CLUMA_CG002583, isoform A [Clunio marinus]
MQVIRLSQLFSVLFLIIGCDARSTQVSAQYSVSDGNGESTRTFSTRGIVEDAVVEDGGILTKISSRTSKSPPRGHKRRPLTVNPSADYEQLPFQPEFFAVKGKVLNDDEAIPTKSILKVRPTRAKTFTSKPKPKPFHSSPEIDYSHHDSSGSSFKYPTIQNEEYFESNLQKSPSSVTKKYKKAEGGDGSLYSYSTINFNANDGDNDSRIKAQSSKRPNNPTNSFKLEQTFGGQQLKFDTEIDDNVGGFRPSPKYTTKRQKSPGKLFKSTEDEFKDASFYDFSIKPRPGQSVTALGPEGRLEKLQAELGVRSHTIAPHKNKFDPQLQGGFKPSFKLRDFPAIHGNDQGSGIASVGQIKTFYDRQEADRGERLQQKLLNEQKSTTKAQFVQFLRAKDEEERLERLVEEQYKLQQQKLLAQEKEAELKHQQQILQRQKEKLQLVEKHLSNKVTRQAIRQKRRPGGPSRRQRQPNPHNFSVVGNQSPVPVRSIKGNEGSYRATFNI